MPDQPSDQPSEPDLLTVLRRTRPWWMLPILFLLVLAALLVLTDVVPLKSLSYAVW